MKLAKGFILCFIALGLAFNVAGDGALAAAKTWCVDASASQSSHRTGGQNTVGSIQAAIDAASDGDTVIVAEGTYVENIRFEGKNIIVRSTDPTDSAVVERTIIEGANRGSVVAFAGTEDRACVVAGFTIRNGIAPYGIAPFGGGICGGTEDNRTQAKMQYNVITGNTASANGGGIASHHNRPPHAARRHRQWRGDRLL